MALIKPEIVAPTYGQGWDSGYSSGLESGWQDGHWDGVRDGRKEREEEAKADIAQAASCFWALLSKYQDRKELARRTHAETEARIAAAVNAERERIAGLLTKMSDNATSCWTCGHSISASDLSRLVDEELGAP